MEFLITATVQITPEILSLIAEIDELRCLASDRPDRT